MTDLELPSSAPGREADTQASCAGLCGGALGTVDGDSAHANNPWQVEGHVEASAHRRNPEELDRIASVMALLAA